MSPLAILLMLAAAPAQAGAQAPRPVVAVATATATVEILTMERVSLERRPADSAPLVRQVDRTQRTVEFF